MQLGGSEGEETTDLRVNPASSRVLFLEKNKMQVRTAGNLTLVQTK